MNKTSMLLALGLATLMSAATSAEEGSASGGAVSGPTPEEKAAADKAAADKAAAEKAEKDAAKKAEKEAAKLKKEAEAAERKAKKEAEKAEKEAKKAQEKAAKEAEKAAKEASKMPEQNGVRRPKPDTLCGKAWTIFDNISAKNGAPASIKESLEAARADGLNEGNVKAEYARWRKFYAISGRIAAPTPDAQAETAATTEASQDQGAQAQ